MRNTLLAGNQIGDGTLDDCNGALHAYGNNLLSSFSDCTVTQNFAGTAGLLNAILSIGPLADNGGPTLTHALLPGSNAIDGSDGSCVDDNSILLATDQRGVARSLGVRCDLGALETLPPVAYLPLIRR